MNRVFGLAFRGKRNKKGCLYAHQHDPNDPSFPFGLLPFYVIIKLPNNERPGSKQSRHIGKNSHAPPRDTALLFPISSPISSITKLPIISTTITNRNDNPILHHCCPIHQCLNLLFSTRVPHSIHITLRLRGWLLRQAAVNKRRRRPLAAVLVTGIHFTSGDILVRNRAVEDAVYRLRLVGSDSMAGVKDAREGDAAVLPNETADI